jgi:type II secretory pathway pseudopilin PulG
MELLIVVSIISVLAATAIPSLIRARMAGSEASAIGSLRAISNGQVNFATNCAGGSYADSLVNLAKPPTAGGEGFVSADLAADPATKSGYIVQLTPGAATAPAVICSTATTAATYAVNADPQTPGTTGSRWFFTNGGSVYEATGAITPVQIGPPTVPASVKPIG